MTTIEVKTRSREELVDITEEVQKVVAQSGVKEGICYLFVPHTTAGITINETWDPSVRKDITEVLRKVAPPGANYHHTEGNADAHIKTSVVGSNAFVFVSDGRLVLGTWQGIYLAEFDGPRSRRVIIHVEPF
jgi:secondary thiamine-phosphate synthase enzyme